jgi:hypothetical protein
MRAAINEEIKYCAFIDVLGYRNLVVDNPMDTAAKLNVLHSLYSNLATSFWVTIGEVNRHYTDKVFIRSFSDCFYLDCSSIEPLLVAVHDIFNSAFGLYKNFSATDEKTPLLRCGIVKDWLVKFRDIAAITSNGGEWNPVGKAVARAYETSEQSQLSGMRVLIAPEVIADLHVQQVTIQSFPCFAATILSYGIPIMRYFKQITTNEKGDPCKLYELLWPFGQVNDHAHEFIEILRKLQPTFPPKAARHFMQTARLFHDSYLISSWRQKDSRIFERDRSAFASLACDIPQGSVGS